MKMSEMKNIPSSGQRQVDFLAGQVTFKAYLPNRVQACHLPMKSFTKISKNACPKD